MKERLLNTNLYQRILIVLMAAAIPLFFVIYQVAAARPGVEYRGAFLRCGVQEGQAVYTGKLRGTAVRFAVSSDGVVDYTCGGVEYEPYVLTEAPTAIPEGTDWADMLWNANDSSLRGVEIRQGGEVLFRGAWTDSLGWYTLVDEKGNRVTDPINITVTGENGKTYDINGKEILPTREPEPEFLIQLVFEPELVHRGDWQFWFMGTLAALGCILLILFADELFRFDLAFKVRDPYRAEPSEWEIATRYIGWTLLAFAAIVSYCLGLAELV